jgi:hypothetical protein
LSTLVSWTPYPAPLTPKRSRATLPSACAHSGRTGAASTRSFLRSSIEGAWHPGGSSGLCGTERATHPRRRVVQSATPARRLRTSSAPPPRPRTAADRQ